MKPMHQIMNISCCAAVVAALATFTGSAQSGESFYEGKSLNVVVRAGPGGGNDTYARLVARHIAKHIPGSRNAIVTNMPGGGGLVASNYMANRAPRDGSVIALLGRDMVLAQRIGATGVRYDARQLIPIGNAASSTWVWIARDDHPVSSLSELKTYDGVMKFGASGAGTGSVQTVALLESEGFPVQVITGYEGTPDRILGMARGELDGTASTYESLRTAIQQEGLKILGRMGRHPELENVQDARELLSPDARALANLMAVPLETGRPFYTAPEVPRDRVQVLRAAFKSVLEDPALLKEAKRANMAIDWTGAEDMERIAEEILNTPDHVIAEFEAM